jgi:hypothetical protein
MFDIAFGSIPYPDNVLLASCAWIVFVICISLWLIALLRRRPLGIFLTSLGCAGLASLLDVGLWIVSIRCYETHLWSAHDPSGVSWWLLDGPVVNTVRDVGHFVLWHVFGVGGVIPAVQYFNGSSVSHVHLSVLFISLLNEAAFSGVVALTGVVAILKARDIFRGRRVSAPAAR